MIVRSKFREFAPIVLLFVVVNALAIAIRNPANGWNIDRDVVIGGNLFLFAITFISFLIAKRGVQSKNTQAFMRAVYSSILFKMFLAAIAAFVFIYISGKELNKPALFICMGLYLIYTFTEVTILTRMLRQKPNE